MSKIIILNTLKVIVIKNMEKQTLYQSLKHLADNTPITSKLFQVGVEWSKRYVGDQYIPMIF